MNYIDVSILRALVGYNPDDGSLFWKRRDPSMEAPGWNFKYAGRPALSIMDDKGYLHGRVLGKNIKAHRAAWSIYHGKWPSGFIDHINGIRSDNRIKNLREATHSQNARNRKPSKSSTSKFLGVHWNLRDAMWESQVNDGCRIIRLGKFKSEIDAALAYDSAAISIHGEFANQNFK